MAATVISGINGQVSWGGVMVELNEWTLDVKGELIDSFAFQQLWKTQVAGARAWSGSAVGQLVQKAGDTNVGGKAALASILNPAANGWATSGLTMAVDTTGTPYGFTGNAWVSGASIKVAAGGLAEITFDFQGTGELHVYGS